MKNLIALIVCLFVALSVPALAQEKQGYQSQVPSGLANPPDFNNADENAGDFTHNGVNILFDQEYDPDKEALYTKIAQRDKEIEALKSAFERKEAKITSLEETIVWYVWLSVIQFLALCFLAILLRVAVVQKRRLQDQVSALRAGVDRQDKVLDTTEEGG